MGLNGQGDGAKRRPSLAREAEDSGVLLPGRWGPGALNWFGQRELAGVLGRETEQVELEKVRGEALPQGNFCLAAFPGALASTALRVLAPIQRPWHA